MSFIDGVNSGVHLAWLQVFRTIKKMENMLYAH